MDFNGILKTSATETAAFAKRNATRFATVADLVAARDGCKTKEARAMIEGLLVPLQKELQKECAAFDAKMSALWKKAKGETVPDDVQKKLDDQLKTTAKTMESGSGKKVQYNSDTGHKQWINLMSLSG